MPEFKLNLNPWPECEQKGYDDYFSGVSKSRNPFQYHSLKNNGPQKAAAWATGWERGNRSR